MWVTRSSISVKSHLYRESFIPHKISWIPSSAALYPASMLVWHIQIGIILLEQHSGSLVANVCSLKSPESDYDCPLGTDIPGNYLLLCIYIYVYIIIYIIMEFHTGSSNEHKKN